MGKKQIGLSADKTTPADLTGTKPDKIEGAFTKCQSTEMARLGLGLASSTPER